MAKCVNHPYSNATYFHNDFTYCELCEEYFEAKVSFDIILIWERPLAGEDTKDFDTKLDAALKILNEKIAKILRN